MKLPSPIGPTTVNSPFGLRNLGGEDRFHNGVDLKAAQGTTIKSPVDGKVITASMNAGTCGGMIEIKTKNIPLLKIIKMCHCSEINVREGETVVAGQVIGKTGGADGTPGAGRSGGPHLHLATYKGKPTTYKRGADKTKKQKNALNPDTFFDYGSGSSTTSSIPGLPSLPAITGTVNIGKITKDIEKTLGIY